MDKQHNPWVEKLLDLQQDGDKSIATPQTDQEILLEVKTDLIKKTSEIFERISNKDEALWHFLIGSPGNGKSHFIKKLYALFLENGWEKVPSGGGAASSLRYRIELVKDHNKVWLVQDASVVRDPHDKDLDEPKELKKELEQAIEKNASLVVCANRGVLEQVYDKHKVEGKEDPAWKAVKSVMHGKEAKIDIGHGPRARKAHIAHDFLDNNSLFYQDSGKVLDELIDLFTKEEKWMVCNKSTSGIYCPFKNNQDALRNPGWRKKILGVLRYSELLLGKPLVFRSLNAFFSNLLAGCSNDYRTQPTKEHPCDRVHEQIEKNDLSGLLSKRFYYQLFSSNQARGFDQDPELRESEKAYIKEIISKIDEDGEHKEARKFLDTMISTDSPEISINVGIEDLLGENGKITKQDPFLAESDIAFLTRWSVDSENIEEELNKLEIKMELEIQAIKLWKSLIVFIEENYGFDNPTLLTNTILRNASSFLLRLGGIDESMLSFNTSIAKFSKLIQLSRDGKDEEAFKLRREVQKEINKILSRISGSENNDIRISEVLSIEGDVISKESDLRIDKEINPPYLKLKCFFGPDKGYEIELDCTTYCWLLEVSEKGLHPRSIPSNLLDSIFLFRSRAIAQSNYSRSAQEFSIYVDTENNQKQKLVADGTEMVLEN